MEPGSNTLTKNQDHLTIYLAEMEVVFSQAHVRMQIVSNYMGLTVALAAGLVAAIGSSPAMQTQLILYLLFPYPFLFFGFLILREDFLMASHSRYFYKLRRRILAVTALSPDEDALGFLPSIRKYQMGPLVWNFLSLLRYAPAVSGVFACIGYYLYKNYLGKTLWPPGYLAGVSLLIIGGLLIAQFVGIAILAHQHRHNEYELLETVLNARLGRVS